MNESLNYARHQGKKGSANSHAKKKDGSFYISLKCETGMPVMEALGPHLLITRTILVANSVPEYDVPSVYVMST